jgi:hypothetical protein
MSRLISKAEGYEAAYEAFQNINFNAFDFYSIKQSMIEYIKLYFPENFNDYIESSEFIALIEVFAYLGEILAYRYDVNAHENIIDFAQRKQSVLRLAKYVSYKSSRNIPARGLVRIDSVSTSERIFDSFGTDLSNRLIRWNDPNNPNWKDQFLLVMNKVLEQDFGTVSPNERKQVNDILFELYPMKNVPVAGNSLRYQTSISGNNYPMELVSSKLTEFGPEEARPDNNANFNIIYGSDGLGDGSLTTGFFVYTKQGTLLKTTTTFDGILPNQTYNIPTNNINETDLWVNNIDPDTGDIVDDGSATEGRSGEWIEVDLANAQNIIFNTNPNRNKYEVETLEDDRVRLVFGDGEFSDVPSGTFDIWYRTSVNEEIYIPRTGVVDKTSSINYVDDNGRTQTFNFTFSLISSLQNNSPSEDIEQIRRNAPAVYYTQDRMVNGRDYNTFPLQDPSILKLRTVNRTFAGQSNFEQTNDPSQTYSDVKVFGEDMALYFTQTQGIVTSPITVTSSALIINYVQPLLSTVDFFLKHLIDYPTIEYRREFTSSERNLIDSAFNSVLYPWPVGLEYIPNDIGSTPDYVWNPILNIDSSDSVQNDRWIILIDRAGDGSSYTITYRGKHLVAESPSTNFYNYNQSERVLTFDNLNSNRDELIILKANISSNSRMLLDDNIILNVEGLETIKSGLPNAGLPNLNQLTVVTKDTNQDSIPDNITLPQLLNIIIPDVQLQLESGSQEITLPQPYVTGFNDVRVRGNFGQVTWNQDGFDINQVDPVANTFTFEGNIISEVSIGDTISIVSSGDIQEVLQNPSYTVSDVLFDGQFTVVSVIEPTVLPTTESTTFAMEVRGRVTDKIRVTGAGIADSNTITVTMDPYVYFSRDTINEEFSIVETTPEVVSAWGNDSNETLYKREFGRTNLNFLWLHRTDEFNLVNPSPTNINDMFVVTRAYYNQYSRWLTGEISQPPTPPTPYELRNSYATILDNKMISDTVVMHSGDFKLIIGDKSRPELRAKIKVVRSANRTLTDNQVKIRIVNIVRDFFDVNKWEYGETFFYTELDTAIQVQMPSDISSTVLVPQHPNHSFGDLYQVFCKENEIFQVDIGVEDIEIVNALNPSNIRQ